MFSAQQKIKNFIKHFGIKVSLLLICLSIVSGWVFSNTYSEDQTKENVDSILSTKKDTEGVKWLLNKSREVLYSEPQVGLEYAQKALEISTRIKNDTLLILSNLRVSNALINQGNYKEAWEMINVAIETAKRGGNKESLAYGLRVMGIWYDLQGDVKNALVYYHRALSIFEEIGDVSGRSSCYNNIGVMSMELGDLQGAIEFYKKSIAINSEIKDQRSLSKSYCNIGNVYIELKDYEQALIYLQKAYAIDEMLEDKQGMAATLHNIGLVFMQKGDYTKATKYVMESLKLCEEMNDLYRIVDRYSTLSELNNTTKDYQNSIIYGNKALELSQQTGSLKQQAYAIKQLTTAYSSLGDFRKAFELQNVSSALNDSIFNIEKTKEVEIIRTNYQVEQKQQELDKANMLASKNKSVRNAFIAAFALSLAVIILIFHNYRNNLKINRIINEKNSELEMANAEILAQRDEVEAQRDMVITQKEKLEEVNNNMTNSLRYAQSIQAAILPSEKVIQQISSEYFVMMKPCELVSGDFFWASTFEHHHVFCLADCTGHGVPGAFMSILGITALNDIVVRHHVMNPAEILGYLRESVIEALDQNDPENIHKDGMDIALCVFNSKTRELQYAGAKLPLLVVKCEDSKDLEIEGSFKPLHLNNLSLYEVKGDIAPVGQSPKMEPFTNHTIQLKNNSVCVYLLTDGFADQLGGNPKSKFGIARLRNLILENAGNEFDIQRKNIEKTFDDWKGLNYQVDDTTVFGIKI